MEEQHARELLGQARERIEAAIAELDRTQRDDDQELSHVDQHPADAGSELYVQEQDAGELERLRQELEAVERAEQRLAEGTYGRSVESGEPIPDARLEAHPTAERTVEEQARYESGG
jgi:DnaK suppressor protein